MQISFINKNNEKSRYNCSCVEFFSFDQQIKNLHYKKGNFKLTKVCSYFFEKMTQIDVYNNYKQISVIKTKSHIKLTDLTGGSS